MSTTTAGIHAFGGYVLRLRLERASVDETISPLDLAGAPVHLPRAELDARARFAIGVGLNHLESHAFQGNSSGGSPEWPLASDASAHRACRPRWSRAVASETVGRRAM